MSNSLTDVYNDISDQDVVYLEKHAEQIKENEEEDAAGRIMARGFADEIHKLEAELATLRAQLDACRNKTIDECADIVIKKSLRITEMGIVIETLRDLKQPANPATSTENRDSEE